MTSGLPMTTTPTLRPGARVAVANPNHPDTATAGTVRSWAGGATVYVALDGTGAEHWLPKSWLTAPNS